MPSVMPEFADDELPRQRLLTWLERAGCTWSVPDGDTGAPLHEILVADCVVHGEVVRLIHDANDRPYHVRAVCSLGDLPPTDELPLMLQLLHANLQMSLEGGSLVLGLHPEDDGVCLSDEISLDPQAENAFRLALFHLSDQPGRWREGRFLPQALL